MKHCLIIAATLAIFSTPAFAVDPPPLYVGPSGGAPLTIGAAASGAAGIYLGARLIQLYVAGEVNHRKLTQCDIDMVSCGTAAGSAPAQFYNKPNTRPAGVP